MTANREAVEGLQWQGVDETIVYSVTTTNWASSPTSPVVVVKDTSADDADVTATVMPTGSASVSGDDITLPPLTALTASHRYRVEVQFASGSSVFEMYFYVQAEE